MTRIYVASSWKHESHDEVVKALTDADYSVYDYRAQAESFQWAQIDKNFAKFDAKQQLGILENPIAQRAFVKDYTAMHEAEACVLLAPSGTSANMEAGWFIGQHKPTIVFLPKPAKLPELIYLAADNRCTTIMGIIRELNQIFELRK